MLLSMMQSQIFKIHRFFTSNHVVTSVACMLLYGGMGLIPAFYVYLLGDEGKYVNFLSYPPFDLSEGDARISLLIITFSALPMAIDLILDAPRYLTSSELNRIGLYRLILVVDLMCPTLIAYIFTFHMTYDEYLFSQIIFELFATRAMIMIICILCLMFCTKTKSPDRKYEKLKESSADYAMYFGIMCVASKFLRTLKFLLDIPSGFDIISTLCWILNHGSDALALYLMATLVIYNLKHNNVTKLNSHNQLGDYLYSLALFIFLSSINVLLIYTDIFQVTTDFSRSFFYSVAGLQLGITLILTVIPGRCHLRHAEIKEEKLQNRLNLIRYMSHEMRTPLNTAILGVQLSMHDIQTMEKLIEEWKIHNTYVNYESNNLEHNTNIITNMTDQSINLTDTLKEVSAACHLTVRTLDDLLTFDKIDEDKLTLECDDHINPWNLLEEVAAPFMINAQANNIHYTIQCQEEDSGWMDFITLKADRFKLSQVIRNLISNAIKFTPSHGSVKVLLEKPKFKETTFTTQFNFSSKSIESEISIESHSILMPKIDSKSTIRILVTDSGAGISKENQKKLFSQYIQFNATKLQHGKGSGLGLWISRNIIELHGGAIEVQSLGEGHGSTFIITLPIQSSSALPSPRNPLSEISAICPSDSLIDVHSNPSLYSKNPSQNKKRCYQRAEKRQQANMNQSTIPSSVSFATNNISSHESKEQGTHSYPYSHHSNSHKMHQSSGISFSDIANRNHNPGGIGTQEDTTSQESDTSSPSQTPRITSFLEHEPVSNRYEYEYDMTHTISNTTHTRRRSHSFTSKLQYNNTNNPISEGTSKSSKFPYSISPSNNANNGHNHTFTTSGIINSYENFKDNSYHGSTNNNSHVNSIHNSNTHSNSHSTSNSVHGMGNSNNNNNSTTTTMDVLTSLLYHMDSKDESSATRSRPPSPSHISKRKLMEGFSHDD